MTSAQHTAIPTLFGGIRYRSRLEACWAAYFSLSGHIFEYEPFDLRGWIPDFLVVGPDGMELLIEVKPFTQFDDSVYAGMAAAAGDLYATYLFGLSPKFSWYRNDRSEVRPALTAPHHEAAWARAKNIVQWNRA